MGTVGRLTTIVCTLLVAVPLALASPAALDSVVVSQRIDSAGGSAGGYATVVVVADVAGTLTLHNLDLAAHDIISEALGPTDNAWCARFAGHHPCPLFASGFAAPLGGQSVVEGTDQLVPGTTYEFYCSIHHWMTGTLVAI